MATFLGFAANADDARDLMIETWIAEAKACPVCQFPWTLAAVKANRGIIGGTKVRILVCRGVCWASWTHGTEHRAPVRPG